MRMDEIKTNAMQRKYLDKVEERLSVICGRKVPWTSTLHKSLPLHSLSSIASSRLLLPAEADASPAFETMLCVVCDVCDLKFATTAQFWTMKDSSDERAQRTKQ